MRPTRREFCAAAAASLLAGCVTRRTPPPPDEAPRSAAGPLERELRIFNWSDYIGAETLARFEREHGVRISYDTYESNEEMVAKLVAGGGGYDLVGPTGYLVPVLVEGGLLEPLDHAVLTGWGNLDPFFVRSASAPGGRYAMPYQWGTTGLAYRTDLVAAPPTGWSVYEDDALAGRMTMLDDGREVLGAALRRRGRSVNSVIPAEIDAARDDALAWKPRLRAYVSATVKGQLISGDVAVAQLWSGDARQAAQEEPRIAFMIPREGSQLFLDYLAVPRGAPHPRAAHAFLNYLLRPEIAAEIAEQTGYGAANAAALARMADPQRLPDAATLARLEILRDLGAATDRWDRAWTEVKAG